MAEEPPPARGNNKHWSRVELGACFDLVLEFDPLVYVQAEVVVPFWRRLPDGLSRL